MIFYTKKSKKTLIVKNHPFLEGLDWIFALSVVFILLTAFLLGFMLGVWF